MLYIIVMSLKSKKKEVFKDNLILSGGLKSEFWGYLTQFSVFSITLALWMKNFFIVTIYHKLSFYRYR